MTSETDGAGADGAEGAEGPDESVDGGVAPLIAADPARIGPYLLLGRLGAGGMGRVYLARSESGRTVAVKVVHEEHVSDVQFRARFRREIDAARRVGERYTAPVLEADPDAALPWVATGYVPGLSLEQVVRGHGPLPAPSVLALADGLLHALKDIHSAGIVHRDLKPSNVMLTVEGPRVIDFGIARAIQTSVESLLTSTGMVIGSPGFMAPEQIRGQSAGPESDVFTLGCVLTYAATGALPFGRGASNQHAVMYQIVEAEPDLGAVADDGLRALIGRCLAKDVAERAGLDELLASLAATRPAPGPASWLPADVVTRLAQQAARLLDAEASAPVREAAPVAAEGAGAVDRETARLRAGAPGEVAAVTDGPSAGAATREGERTRRRRPLVIALPVVAVLSVGGGTVAILQPFGGDGGDSASPPSSSAPVTPGPHASPSPEGSPSKGGKSKGKDGDKGKDDDKDKKDKDGGKGEGGKDGKDGADGADGKGDGGEGSGDADGSKDGGSGSSAGGGTSPGDGSGSGSGSGDGGSAGSGNGGGGGGGGSVPTFFAGTWKFSGDFNLGQPDTVTISRSGAVRLTMEKQASCTYAAKVTSSGSQGSRINVGTATFVGSRPPMCYPTLDPSYFTVNGSGIQHNVGPSHGDGYYYARD
ncbi:serine/threonine-protein kinase [Streptomyces sp. NPDC087300]|uniref:serine/threonine-protein kinase n=1 Tax=Streptomyces sp. NPDC087300 TaxID=3365780 RepID=UPI0038223A95